MIVRSKSLYLHQFVKAKLKEAVKIQKSLSVIEVDVFFESTYQIAIIALFFLAGKLKNKSSPMQIYSPVLCWGVFLCFLLFFSFVSFCFVTQWLKSDLKKKKNVGRCTEDLFFPLAHYLKTYTWTSILNHSSRGVPVRSVVTMSKIL